MGRILRVLIAEDSIFIQKILERILQSDPEIKVVGLARNGQQAVELVRKLRPDVVTMDIRMPVMDGFQATRIIMSEHPTPILVVSSSVNADDLKISFNAIQAGALDIMEKPRGSLSREYNEIGRDLIRKIKLVSEIKVFRHLMAKPLPPTLLKPIQKTRSRAVALGASTGGPSALFSILTSLPEDFPVPIFVTQHIAEGFGKGCVEWIGRFAKLRICIPEDGESVQPGVVYFAPDDRAMRPATRTLVSVDATKMDKRAAPINQMMEAFADTYGAGGIGVLLTGMGDDGAAGMKKLRDLGGHTIAQDEATSVVYGMPKAALQLGGAEEVMPLEAVAQRIMSLLTEES